jgi:hypothetical protein
LRALVNGFEFAGFFWQKETAGALLYNDIMMVHGSLLLLQMEKVPFVYGFTQWLWVTAISCLWERLLGLVARDDKRRIFIRYGWAKKSRRGKETKLVRRISELVLI